MALYSTSIHQLHFLIFIYPNPPFYLFIDGCSHLQVSHQYLILLQMLQFSSGIICAPQSQGQILHSQFPFEQKTTYFQNGNSKGEDKLIHSQLNKCINVVKAYCSTEAAHIEIANKVGERKERPVEQIEIRTHINPKYNMGMSNIEDQKPSQAGVG